MNLRVGPHKDCYFLILLFLINKYNALSKEEEKKCSLNIIGILFES